jgi:hypothetical protein
MKRTLNQPNPKPLQIHFQWHDVAFVPKLRFSPRSKPSTIGRCRSIRAYANVSR